MRENSKKIRSEQPHAVAAFDKFLVLFYVRFSDQTLSSVADLATPAFDDMVRLKHDFQIEVFGDAEKQAWNGWNDHFLQTIAEVNRQNHGKRIVVVVGAEHHYWLKQALLNDAALNWTALPN